MNLDEILKAAQSMQEKLGAAQNRLDEIMVDGASGGGMVRVQASAKGRVARVEIDPSLLEPGSKEMLEDLIVAAMNDARVKAEAAAGAEMQKVTAGLPIPPGMKMPF
jgi:DNA-binding YbaB/EbfC family protein